MSDTRLEDFKSDFEFRYPFAFNEEGKSQKVRIQVYMPVLEYYEISVFCITRKLSITQLLRTAVRKEIASIKKQEEKDKRYKKNTKPRKSETRSLF